jgi:hypothetical protein
MLITVFAHICVMQTQRNSSELVGYLHVLSEVVGKAEYKLLVRNNYVHHLLRSHAEVHFLLMKYILINMTNAHFKFQLISKSFQEIQK